MASLKADSRKLKIVLPINMAVYKSDQKGGKARSCLKPQRKNGKTENAKQRERRIK